MVEIAFTVALFSLFAQKCLDMWGFTEWMEIRFGWCNWCFRFWLILLTYAIFWRVGVPHISLASFVDIGASALMAYIIEKILLYVDYK